VKPEKKNSRKSIPPVKRELDGGSVALKVQNQQLRRTVPGNEKNGITLSELFELAPVAYFVLSDQREIIMVNRAGARLLQSPKESLLGKQFDAYVALDYLKEFHSFCLHVVDALVVESTECGLKTPLGLVLNVEIAAMLNENGSDDDQILFVVHDTSRTKQTEEVLRQTHYDLLREVKDRATELDRLNRELESEVLERRVVEKVLRDREEELNQKHDELKALTSQLITAQDLERRRLSQELHDDFSQQLVSLSMEIQNIQKGLGTDTNSIRNELQTLRGRALEMAQQVHQLAYQLHPPVLDDLGLVAALRSYISDWEAQERIKVNFDDRDLPPAIPAPIAACLYRVTQEGLRNVARHSRSGRVAVTVTYDDETLSLSIRDWGIGFSKNQQNGHHGLGIWSMKERVHLVKGQFFIKSSRRQGTEILVQVPLARSSP
jgi:PAS domain S-box-containing protein